jgi:indole-3-glycerol phosphate synthase
VSRLTHAVAEGDGISVLVEVADEEEAAGAEQQGADALVVRGSLELAESQLPLLHLGGVDAARQAEADAVVISVEGQSWQEARDAGLDCVVRVSDADELERALEELDPEVFLLSPEPDVDDTLESLLGLLHDVPAGKLAIAELRSASPDDVAELERAGVDAVLVAARDVVALVSTELPEF